MMVHTGHLVLAQRVRPDELKASLTETAQRWHRLVWQQRHDRDLWTRSTISGEGAMREETVSAVLRHCTAGGMW